jgi:glycosyltransferase involved in cell wall biosynthesis
MKFTVVTISFNQSSFLEQAICSVLDQKGVDVEYIIVDPGSTDGSRDIIEKYRNRIARVIFEKDNGPADGLNKGFALATGDIYCYLNSDDTFEPEAFRRVGRHFETHPSADVICGHAWITDHKDQRLRRVWSDPYWRLMVAYGAAIQIQPSTFFRGATYRKGHCFNPANRISWDSELLLDFALDGAQIEILDAFLSTYRIHAESITGAALHQERALEQSQRRFARLMGREWRTTDDAIAKLMFAVRQIRHPRACLERILHGPVYGRATSST